MYTLPFLISFFNNVDVLFFIMVRVLAFFIFLPVLSSMGIPMQVRLFAAFVISVTVFTTGFATTATYYDSPAGLIVLIIHEFMTGALMGFGLAFIMNVLLFAGQFIDFSMGFAMVNVLDPVQQIQVPVMGNLLFMSMGALLVTTGGLHELIFAFFHSFDLVPIGTALILDNQEFAWFMVVSFVGFFLLAVRIAIPIVGTMLIIDICLGIMVKAVPQMNVFVVGMPLKVLVGLILMFTVMLPSFGMFFDWIFDDMFNLLVATIHGMMP